MKESNKYIYLIKNIGILTISNFGSKLLSFILIPLYTSALTTAEYGTYDLYQTTIALFVPILTVNVVDAVIRFSIEGTYPTKDVFSIGINRIAFSSIVFGLILTVNHIFNVSQILDEYWFYLLFLYIGNTLYDLLARFARGIDKISVVAISGFINATATLIFSILFLVIFKSGLEGYFIATILAYLVSIIYLAFRINIIQFYTVHQNHELKKKMFIYIMQNSLESIQLPQTIFRIISHTSIRMNMSM